MKQISELIFPGDLRYSEDHEWASLSGETVKIGITDYAQDQLGDIVFVELPAVGDVFAKAKEFGSIESVKAVSELFIPMGGEVVAINQAIEDAPELVASSPYDAGWLIEIRPSNKAEFKEMMDQETYLESLRA
jgi:glycine cleavage system H protein